MNIIPTPGRLSVLRLLRPGGDLARGWAICLTVLVSVLLLMPHLKAPENLHSQSDLLVHLGLQGALGFSLLWAWPSRSAKTWLVLAALVVGLEVGQIWVPGREFSGPDLLTNALGAGLGALLARWLVRHFRH